MASPLPPPKQSRVLSHDPQRLIVRQGQALRPRLGDEIVVLDAEAAPSLDIDARLYRHDVADMEDVLQDRKEAYSRY